MDKPNYASRKIMIVHCLIVHRIDSNVSLIRYVHTCTLILHLMYTANFKNHVLIVVCTPTGTW